MVSAQGAQADADVISRNWQRFQSLNVTPVNGPYGSLKYYGRWGTAITTAKALLEEYWDKESRGVFGGQCAAWTDLFLQTLAENGIRPDRPLYQIQGKRDETLPMTPDNPTQRPGFLIKQWTFIQPDPPPHNVPGHQNYRFVNYYDNTAFQLLGIGANQYLWLQARPAQVNWVRADSLRGQGNTFPKADFDVHIIVKIGTTYYDPSYGRRYPAATDAELVRQFEEVAIAGYRVKGPTDPTVLVGPNMDRPAFRMFFKRKDPNSQGIEVVPKE